jgi:hypothetical protein
LALAVACALLLLSAPVHARRVEVSDELMVDHEPDRLVLRHRERGTVELTITNTGERTLLVELEHQTIRNAGASGGNLDMSLVRLQDGEMAVITVTVESFASFLGEHGVSDCHIRIRWGPDPSPGSSDFSIDGEATIIIPVDDDFTVERFVIIGVVLLVVAILAAVVWLVGGRGGGLRGAARQP